MLQDKIDILDRELQIKEMKLNEVVENIEGINEFEGNMTILRSLFNYANFKNIDVKDKLNTIGKKLSTLRKLVNYDLSDKSHVIIKRIENNIMKYAKNLGVDSILRRQDSFYL